MIVEVNREELESGEAGDINCILNDYANDLCNLTDRACPNKKGKWPADCPLRSGDVVIRLKIESAKSADK